MSKNIKIGGEVINGVSAIRVESADEEGVLIQFPDEGGTIVYVNGQAVATFDADTKLDKQTGASTYGKAYIKNADGTQGMTDITQNVESYALPMRSGTGQIKVPQTPSADGDAASKKYVDDNFLAKQKGTTSYWQVYTKVNDGSQQMTNCSDNTVLPTSIVVRTSGGQIACADPTANSHAATKAYVDGNFTGKRYTHSLLLTFTFNSVQYKALFTFVNSSSTAITTMDGRGLWEYFKGATCVLIEHSDTSNYHALVPTVSWNYSHDDEGIGFMLMTQANNPAFIDGIDTSKNASISGVSVVDTVTAF